MSYPKTLSLRYKALVLALAVFLVAQTALADGVVGLMDDGRIIYADTDDFSNARTTIATLDNSEASYCDITYGDGAIYALRADGAVYRSDLNGNVEEVPTSGWPSNVHRIDFADGTLYGLSVETNTSVYDSGGNIRLEVVNFKAEDFGIDSNGSISLLLRSENTWVYTFDDGYKGTPKGGAFINFVSGQTPITLDVSEELITVLSLNTKTNGKEWRFQKKPNNDVVFARANVTNAISIAISNDNKNAFFLAPEDANIIKASIEKNAELNTVGQLAVGTGVGVVAVDQSP